MTDIPDDEQKILAEMPLHAITAVYGEQGLRARLAIETGRLDDAAGRQKISEALELAGREPGVARHLPAYRPVLRGGRLQGADGRLRPARP